MLDPIYLWYVTDKIVDIWNELNEWAIKDIAERIMAAELYKYDKLPGTARWRAWLLQQSGMHYDEMLTRISKLTQKSEETVRQLFVEAGLMSVENDEQIYKKHNIEVPDIRQDKQLTQILESTYKQTNGEMRNYTRTTLDASNKLMIDTLDKAYFDIKSGNKSYSETIKEAIDTVSKQGLTVTYPSGHRDTIETAVRRAVMTGLNQGTAKVSLANCEKLGAEYVVISAHEGARVSDDPVANHLGWQGKIFKLKGSTRKYKNLKEATGFPDNPLGLCGYNCRHNLYPHFLGDPNPWEDVANKAQENKESYEIAQKQRQMERAIRKSKRQLLGYQTGIDNCEDEKTKFELQMEYDRLANRLQRQNKAYNEFCKENNLVKESDRLRVAGWNRGTADKARSGAAQYKKIALNSQNDIMKRKNRAGNYIEPMPKNQLQKIVKSFKRNGGTIQMNDYTDEYLRKKGAEAITYDSNTILLHTNPGRASVFEELIHTWQYRTGRNDGTYKSRLLCEIEAQEKLIKYKDAYKLTESEVKQTQRALELYRLELQQYYTEGGD